MSATIAKIVLAIAGLLKPLGYFFTYWLGGSAKRREIEAEIAARNAEKQARYAEIASEPRTSDSTAERMRKGDF